MKLIVSYFFYAISRIVLAILYLFPFKVHDRCINYYTQSDDPEWYNIHHRKWWSTILRLSEDAAVHSAKSRVC